MKPTKNKLKFFCDYMNKIGSNKGATWNPYEWMVETIHGPLRVSVHEKDFTKVGKPINSHSNFVSIFTCFMDFERAKPYLAKVKMEKFVLNPKCNWHLSGGSSVEENWMSNFYMFQKELEKILLTPRV